jgi:hypothetical protein
VYARLGADPALGALVVPLLCDPLIGGAADAPSPGPRPRAGSRPQGPAPEVAGALVNALEGMACACAMAGGARSGGGGGEGEWSYDQALKLLLKLYREPSAVRAGPRRALTLMAPASAPIDGASQGRGARAWGLQGRASSVRARLPSRRRTPAKEVTCAVAGPGPATARRGIPNAAS